MSEDLKSGEGVKYDGDKLKWELVPYDAVAEIVKILTFGAKKYAPRNWERGMDWDRPYAGLMRHMTAWFHGEDNDPETGISHLAHAGCCLLFLIAYEKRGIGNDNRPKLDQMDEVLEKCEKASASENSNGSVLPESDATYNVTGPIPSEK